MFGVHPHSDRRMMSTTTNPGFGIAIVATIAAAQLVPSPRPRPDGDDDDYYTVPPALCDSVDPYSRRLNSLTIARSAVGAVGTIMCLVAVMKRVTVSPWLSCHLMTASIICSQACLSTLLGVKLCSALMVCTPAD